MSSATYETLWLLRQGDDYHPLFEGRAILGRNEDVEVPLADPLASRQHAELDVTAAVVRIRDLGSRNGVQMRGRVLPAHAWVEMAAGEEIVIGTTRLVLLRERPRGRLVTHEKVRALPRPRRRRSSARPAPRPPTRPSSRRPTARRPGATSSVARPRPSC